MCTVLLPPGGYPIAVNKYIIQFPGQAAIKQSMYPLNATEQNRTHRANRSNTSNKVNVYLPSLRMKVPDHVHGLSER
jgi:hypothetical protein